MLHLALKNVVTWSRGHVVIAPCISNGEGNGTLYNFISFLTSKLEKRNTRSMSYFLPSLHLWRGGPGGIGSRVIALVWFVNGFICKVLNLVPRHQEIVGRILGVEDAWLLTKIIGVSEILMAVWIIGRIRSRLCAITQMVIIATMNVIEFTLAPDLLLFGKMNIFFAFLFIIFIYVNEFVKGKAKPVPLTE